jgi:hypothetical protein
MRSFHPIVFGYLASRRPSPMEDDLIATSDRDAAACTGNSGAIGCSRPYGVDPICGSDSFRTLPPAAYSG